MGVSTFMSLAKYRNWFWFSLSLRRLRTHIKSFAKTTIINRYFAFLLLLFVHIVSLCVSAGQQCYHHTAKVETVSFWMAVIHALSRSLPRTFWICDDMERSTVNVIKLFMSQLISEYNAVWWFQRVNKKAKRCELLTVLHAYDRWKFLSTTFVYICFGFASLELILICVAVAVIAAAAIQSLMKKWKLIRLGMILS